MITINNAAELAAYLGCEPTQESISRRVYKDTECGAWVRLLADGSQVVVGSIVEGSDAEVFPETLTFPFEASALEHSIEQIEGEADRLWNEANADESTG